MDENKEFKKKLEKYSEDIETIEISISDADEQEDNSFLFNLIVSLLVKLPRPVKTVLFYVFGVLDDLVKRDYALDASILSKKNSDYIAELNRKKQDIEHKILKCNSDSDIKKLKVEISIINKRIKKAESTKFYFHLFPFSLFSYIQVIRVRRFIFISSIALFSCFWVINNIEIEKQVNFGIGILIIFFAICYMFWLKEYKKLKRYL